MDIARILETQMAKKMETSMEPGAYVVGFWGSKVQGWCGAGEFPRVYAPLVCRDWRHGKETRQWKPLCIIRD